MRFSAFARFGFLAFAGKPPVSEVIYHSLRSAMGGEENLGEDRDSGPLSAKLYATAMSLGTVQRTIDRVNRERVPRLSDEFLARHELAYQVTPPALATKDERRAELALAERLSLGCAPDVLEGALQELLGSRLIAIRVAGALEFAVTPAGWDGAAGPGAWKRPDTKAKWRQLAARVWPGVDAVQTTDIGMRSDDFVAGEVCVVDPGVSGIQEQVTLSQSGGNLVATFARPHDAGALITTEPWPVGQTTSRHVLIVVDHATAISTDWRRRIAVLLAKMLRAVDTWDVVEESVPGTIGPFRVGEGMIGITPIGTLPTVP